MTRTLIFEIDAHTAGLDIRTFVRKELSLSARVLTALKYEGEIKLNNEPAHSNALLHCGDKLSLTLFDEAGEYDAVAHSLDILFEDEDFLVINKPANMPVHPSPGHDRDSVLNAAAWYFKEESNFTFRPLYRLDRDTIGVLVLAKNKFAACAELEKTYSAVCEGETPANDRIDKPIGLMPGHKVQRCTGIGQPSVTLFETAAFNGKHSLVRCRLLTGRTHQIRVHMSSIGHPLAGDDLYGGSLSIASQQMLCCSSVKVSCPVLGKCFTVSADFSGKQKALFPGLFGV